MTVYANFIPRLYTVGYYNCDDSNLGEVFLMKIQNIIILAQLIHMALIILSQHQQKQVIVL